MYAIHIPVAVFSLALVIDGVSVIGVVYDSFTDSMYTTIKDQETFKNDERIKENDYILEDIRTVYHCDMWSKVKYNVCNVFTELRKITRLNDIGSIARSKCCVVTGDYSLSIFTGTERKHCYIVAVKVIGEKVMDLFGNEQRYGGSKKGAVIRNNRVHDEVVKVIKEYII